MNEPKPPPDPPEEGQSADPHPHGMAPHGVPEEVHEAESKGMPHSDRDKTEKAVTKP